MRGRPTCGILRDGCRRWFKQLDLDQLKKALKEPVIFDARNIYESIKAKSAGFRYLGIGRC